jgi:hypothetical protein
MVCILSFVERDPRVIFGFNQIFSEIDMVLLFCKGNEAELFLKASISLELKVNQLECQLVQILACKERGSW